MYFPYSYCQKYSLLTSCQWCSLHWLLACWWKLENQDLKYDEMFTLAISLNNVNVVLDPYSSRLLPVTSSTWGKEKSRHCNFNLNTQFNYNMTLRSPMSMCHGIHTFQLALHSSSILLNHETPELKSGLQPHSVGV
jgi:hypothetical protein